MFTNYARSAAGANVSRRTWIVKAIEYLYGQDVKWRKNTPTKILQLRSQLNYICKLTNLPLIEMIAYLA